MDHIRCVTCPECKLLNFRCPRASDGLAADVGDATYPGTISDKAMSGIILTPRVNKLSAKEVSKS
jgi:hypothetical protein